MRYKVSVVLVDETIYKERRRRQTRAPRRCWPPAPSLTGDRWPEPGDDDDYNAGPPLVPPGGTPAEAAPPAPAAHPPPGAGEGAAAALRPHPVSPHAGQAEAGKAALGRLASEEWRGARLPPRRVGTLGQGRGSG